MSPTGPYYAGTAVDGGGGAGAWTNPGNATGAADGVYASGNISSGGSNTNNLVTTNFGFNIPSFAVIDGIYVEFDRYGLSAQTLSVQIVKGGSLAGTAKAPLEIWPVTQEAWIGYGGSADLWGTTWTAANINSSNFGVAMSVRNTHGGGTAFVDSVRITVYWHTPPADVPKRYVYQSFSNSGQYLGNLPNVTSDFSYPLEINTAGSQITIECGVSADTAYLSVDNLTDEGGNLLTDESSDQLTDEGQMPIVAPGNSTLTALIKNGNKVKVYEYGYWNPNGKCVFLGQMQRWEASYGGGSRGSGGSATSDTNADKVTILCYSDGQDLDNFLITKGQVLDQSQTTTNSTFLCNSSVSPIQVGQAVGPGAGVTGVSRITLKLAAVTTNNPTVTVSLYASRGSGAANLSAALSFATPDATAAQVINSTTAATYDFFFNYTFPSGAPGNYYVFIINCTDASGVNVSYTTSTPYAFNMFGSSNPTGDLYFQTYQLTTATSPSFSSEDPANMLLDMLNGYGGVITASTSSLQSTGLSLTYAPNTNTVFEGIQAVLSFSPNGYYWYVDLGTDVLYYRQTNTVADITLTKGLHLDQITLISTIENIKNTAYFSGGVVGGNNLYVQSSNAASVALYGQRLDRLSDNRITDTTTGRQVALADVLQHKDEQYQTTITVLDKTIDTTTLKPGLVIGFNGFGTFVDNLLAQIVRIDYMPEEVTLTLGLMPKRLHPAFDKLIRGLIAQQTIANPSTPS